MVLVELRLKQAKQSQGVSLFCLGSVHCVIQSAMHWPASCITLALSLDVISLETFQFYFYSIL